MLILLASLPLSAAAGRGGMRMWRGDSFIPPCCYPAISHRAIAVRDLRMMGGEGRCDNACRCEIERLQQTWAVACS